MPERIQSLHRAIERACDDVEVHSAGCKPCCDAGDDFKARCPTGQALVDDLDALLTRRNDIVRELNSADHRARRWCMHSRAFDLNQED